MPAALDPVVVAISPPHDSRKIARASPIVIQFSQPMDIASVEAAFSTAPAIHGTFSWQLTHDSVTFIPQDPGFPPQTMMQIHLADIAHAAATGNRISGGFESRFETGNR